MLVLGHRGAPHRAASENTLEAFTAALRQGADGIECDVRLSRDHKLIVVHDSNLHRIAGDAHKVSELTAAELVAIPLRNGGTISTLDEVVAQLDSSCQLDLEIKQREVITPLIERLRLDSSLRARVVISAFLIYAIEYVQRELPDIRTVLLLKRWPLPLRRRRLWRRLQQLAPWGVAFPLPMLNSRRVLFLQQQGLQVGAWDMRGTRREARQMHTLDLDIAIVRRVKEYTAIVIHNSASTP